AGWKGMYVIQPQRNGQMTVLGGYENEDCTVASDVVVYEETAYLVCEYGGLQILDLYSDPTTPQLVGTWQIEAPSQHNNGRRLYEDIVLDPLNQRLYLAVAWDGVYVLDISSPQQPTVQAVIQPPGAVVGLSVFDDVIYTVEGWPQGMTAVDIGDIDEPVELAYLERQSAGVNVLVVGDYAYIGHSNGALSMVRIERP
ncbi:MAG: LVIVD repeat-containing protein, partial [Anaerolineales bacterium]